MAKSTYEAKVQPANKYALLGISIFMDIVGWATYAVPILGEGFDLVWAPVSAFLLFRMYGKKEGLAGGMLQFVEELTPGLDFIPTYTLVWLWKHVLNKKV
ncbi:MAG: hypothetical protein MRY83_23665 [Flavobacteriales bacterium]|nr:hypothetical protein [Flavobacteriales bacterium]